MFYNKLVVAPHAFYFHTSAGDMGGATAINQHNLFPEHFERPLIYRDNCLNNTQLTNLFIPDASRLLFLVHLL